MMADKTVELVADAAPIHVATNEFHYARRGSTVHDKDLDGDAIRGYDGERMRARTLLTAEEEKKLMRRVDWRLMVRLSSTHC
jgi:hypothetical protein